MLLFLHPETGGTLETDVSKVETSRCCLTDEMILRLATLGIEVNSYFLSKSCNRLVAELSKKGTGGMEC